MEEIFNLLKKDKKNTLDGLIQFLKDTQVIDGKKLTEDTARSFFEGVDKNNVELPKFEEAINKMAEHVKEKPEDLKKKIIDDNAKKILSGGHKINLSGFKHKLEDMTKETTAKLTGLAEKAEAATSQALNQVTDLAQSAADDVAGVFEKNKKKAEEIAKVAKSK